MEDEANKRPQPQVEEQHDKAYTAAATAAAVDGTTTTATKVMDLSDESDAGEPEENYRGWKAMPYVIGELALSVYTPPSILPKKGCACTINSLFGFKVLKFFGIVAFRLYVAIIIQSWSN